ncbi:MAG: hypothetical protein ACRC10_06565 [Thermoguttaceae bacterium]
MKNMKLDPFGGTSLYAILLAAVLVSMMSLLYGHLGTLAAGFAVVANWFISLAKILSIKISRLYSKNPLTIVMIGVNVRLVLSVSFALGLLLACSPDLRVFCVLLFLLVNLLMLPVDTYLTWPH